MKRINKLIQAILIVALSINLIFIVRGLEMTGGKLYNPIAYIFIILSILELICAIFMTKKQNLELTKQIIIIFILIIQFTIMWNVKVIIDDNLGSGDLVPAVMPNYYNIYGKYLHYK